VVKARSLSWSGALERCSTRVVLSVILGLKGLPGTATIAYYKLSLNYDHKKYYNIGPWASMRKKKSFITLASSVI
jgi:hypothetical protein